MVERHVIAFWIAGCFALAASLLSFYQMRQHVRWNGNELLRTHILRILLMVPVYALESWLGLRFNDTALYFDIARECYEALVIYSFFEFLVGYLGGENAVIAALSTKPGQAHLFPFCFLKPWRMGAEFFYLSKVGTLQYVIIKPVLAVITFALASTGDYEDGQFDASNGYPYVAFVNNATQVWALYCLVLFYYATKDDLAPIKPVPKFLVVKAVVFFTFWQAVGLAVLVRIGVIQDSDSYSAQGIVTSLQDFLVCVEMFIAAIAHHYAFHYKEFYDPSRPGAAPAFFGSLMQAVNVTDVYLHETRRVFRSKRRRRRRSSGRSGDDDSSEQVDSLLSVEEPSPSLSPQLTPDASDSEEPSTPHQPIALAEIYTPPSIVPLRDSINLDRVDKMMLQPPPMDDDDGGDDDDDDDETRDLVGA